MKKNIVLLFTAVIITCQAGSQLLSPYVQTVTYIENLNSFKIAWKDTNSITPDSFKIFVANGQHMVSGEPTYDIIGTTKETFYYIPPDITISKTYDLLNNVYFFAVEALKTGMVPSNDNHSRRPYIDEPSNVLLNLTQNDFDKCHYTVTLKWNKFYGWNNNSISYEIYYKIGNGSFNPWMNNTSKYFHDTIAIIPVNDIEKRNVNLAFNTNYSFYVIDENNDGFCFSNIRTINTNIPRKPDFINADGTRILDGNHIQFSFTRDTDSEMFNYYILRSDNYNGPFVKIDSILNDKSINILYTDSADALNSIYFYKVEALNSCMLKVNESDTASTIVLKGGKNGNVINLNWNSYQKFAGKIRDYTVYRSMQGRPVSSSVTNDTFATDRLDTVAVSGTFEISYYVIANETDNPHGIAGLARSNTLLVTIIPQIKLDDFFTPNGDGKNDKYKAPVFSYAKEFKFIIYDRWGTKVFETTNSISEGWDGKANGSAAPQGAYIYYLKIVGSDNSTLEQRGTFLLIMP